MTRQLTLFGLGLCSVLVAANAVSQETGNHLQTIDSSTHNFVADGQWKIELNNEPVTSLNENPGGTPYLYPLFAPGQVPVTRGFPMEPHSGEPTDHPHHKSLWIAHGDIDGVDFWTGKGRVWTRSIFKQANGDSATLRVATSMMRDGKRFCDIDTAWSFSATSSVRIIDAKVTLRAADQDVRFGDTKEGFFAIRLHPDLQLVATPKLGVDEVFGQSINSNRQSGGEVWGKPAAWVCYFGPVDQKPVSVIVMDHPKNLRHPTTWHARDYGLFAANPFGLHDFLGQPQGSGDVVLSRNRSMVFRYRILLAADFPDADTIDNLFADFAESSANETGDDAKAGTVSGK